ncbi:hypothetical protein RD792_011162 [Penstemon davidsonii]|uniref:Uncharacterized protein n=1 Tax=Penstemon davidsonii TaxID=160366 RepID=A0ABR0D3T6_9LAMI|nr:hypothetical protein RD792_011162 [Penstemon davidsonii]
MAETINYPVESDVGCGFISAFLPRRGFKPRKTVLFRTSPHSATPRPVPVQKQPINPVPVVKQSRPSNATRSSTSSSNNSRGSNKAPQVVNFAYTKKLTKEPTFTSTDLSLTVLSDQKKFDPNAALYRASTGNVMLLGHLGNLNQQRKDSKKDVGNIVARKSVEKDYQFGNIFNNSTAKLSPDVIKNLGNEKYKEGKYEEALALYNQAIAIDPSKACFYSNKSAALMGLGRLLEAVVQCREAVRIDSSYYNAHCRLAKLYLRLGVAEKAIYHYKCSGRKASHEDIAQAQALKDSFDLCSEARNQGDWNKLIDESQVALSLGADSSPQIYAMKAEALLKLRKHEEANIILQNVPCFGNELYAEFFGSSVIAGLSVVCAQVYMAIGRFEDAVSAVQQALQLDSSNQVQFIAERVKYVVLARSNGNRLFKLSMFKEALISYNEGLDKDPYNSILLCNRAACRSKLGQFEKAVEDCTSALILLPSYRKARLRRADSNSKLEKWEAAILDYEVLMQEFPGDEEVREALMEAKMQCGIIKEKGNVSNHVIISSKRDFTHFRSKLGLLVVLFCGKMCSKQVLQLLEEICQKFPSVNFLKVSTFPSLNNS